MEKILALIPDELLTGLAVETGVDYYAKKLQGRVLFRLLLYSLLTQKDNSLRSVASIYESALFSILNANTGSIRYNSISERLSTINAGYFKSIYEHCIGTYKSLMATTEQEKLVRFDSTIVALSGKLLDIGYNLKGGSSAVRQIKFTVGYTDIPEVLQYYDQQKYNAENAALKETILADADRDKLQIRVFDRGITGRATYDAFTEAGIRFVSRVNPGAAHEQLGPDLVNETNPVLTNTLCINADMPVTLFGQKTGKTRYPLRCIKATSLKEGGKEIWFITNLSSEDFTATEVTEIYRKRWDIEIFFRFLKQHLTFSHLINRSANGIQVMMYVTMIAAILVIAYRKLNDLSGFKMPRQKLAHDLETEIIKLIIIHCGGNVDKLKEIHNPNSS